jgi:hypothetical protein
VTWRLTKLAFWASLAVAVWGALTQDDEEPTVLITRYTVLDDDFPAYVAELVVKYICAMHKDPRWVLAGRAEFAALRSYPQAYVLSVEKGERWYFQSVLIIPVALDSFLEVAG